MHCIALHYSCPTKAVDQAKSNQEHPGESDPFSHLKHCHVILKCMCLPLHNPRCFADLLRAAWPSCAGPQSVGALFDTNMSIMEADQKICRLSPAGVALSGGPDSTALTYLLHRHVQLKLPPFVTGVIALIIDHGLRKDSHSEAQQVGRWMHERGGHKMSSSLGPGSGGLRF